MSGLTDEDWTEINEWIEDVHTGSDGFYIESRLVVALRDEVERLREQSGYWEALARFQAREITILSEIAQDMADCDPIHESGADGFDACTFCAYPMGRHEDACAWVKARARLGSYN